jgi:hypothetical protein
MITSVMLARQISLLDTLPITLTPLLRYSCKLFVAPKNIKSFAIKQIRILAQNTGGCERTSAWPVHESQVTSHKSRPFSCLQPPCRLFALFSALVPFVFISLQPLFPKHPGWGVPLRQLRALCGSALSFAVVFPPIGVSPSFSIRAAQG